MIQHMIEDGKDHHFTVQRVERQGIFAMAGGMPIHLPQGLDLMYSRWTCNIMFHHNAGGDTLNHSTGVVDLNNVAVVRVSGRCSRIGTNSSKKRGASPRGLDTIIVTQAHTEQLILPTAPKVK